MFNVNPETGIRYGMIACNNLEPELLDALWYVYGKDLSYEEALNELKAEVRREVEFEQEDGFYIDDVEDEINDRVESRAEWIQIDEPTIEGQHEGVKYRITWLGGAPMLWVFESPITGEFVLCSPCVPNCCDLDHPQPGGCVGYDVPADWRRDE